MKNILPIMNRYPLSMKITFMLLAIILFFYGIIAAKDFLYPIVLGVLLGYLGYPITCYLEKKGFPRIPASLFSVLFFLFIVSFALIIIYRRAGTFIDQIPLYKQQALQNIDKMETLIEDQFGLSDLRLVEFFRSRIKYFFEIGNETMNQAFASAAGTIFRLAILPVYMFLFLYYRTKLAYFILQLVPKENRKVGIKILANFSTVVARYIGGMATVVVILAILNSIGLLLIGIENPFVFGIISACFSFIPYFGTFIGGSIPFLFSLLINDSPLVALKIIILYLIIHLIENNILAPNIVGNSLRLNPLVIIVGIIAGGMVWGIPGMFAIVPLLAMLNIMSENVVRLHAYSFLLGPSGTRRHAITIENIKSSWTRIVHRIKKIGKNKKSIF